MLRFVMARAGFLSHNMVAKGFEGLVAAASVSFGACFAATESLPRFLAVRMSPC